MFTSYLQNDTALKGLNFKNDTLLCIFKKHIVTKRILTLMYNFKIFRFTAGIQIDTKNL